MKKVVTACVFIFAAVSLQAQNLTWEIKFLKGSPPESLQILRPITIKAGEDFYITIKPDSDCFCYVMGYGTEQYFELYGGSMKGKNEEIILPGKIYPDMLYVIMSMERQTILENLLQSYKANPNSVQNGDNLRQEIARLQETASGLGQPSSSFIQTGGTTRGSSEQYATHFSEKNIYVRPIAIRH